MPAVETFYQAADGQRLEQQQEATAAADGTATFTFPPVPEGMIWTGTLQVPTAPIVANFSATVATTPWGAWSGGLPFGPVQIDGRLALIVRASGLNAGVKYRCALIGVSEFGYPTGLLSPAALATPPQASRILQANTTTTAVSFTSSPLDVSNFPGASFAFINDAFSSAVAIYLQYYATLAEALATTLPGAGYRLVVVDTGDSATFQIRHLADWLIVRFQSLDAGTFGLTWEATQRPDAVDMWMPGQAGSLGPDVLLGPQSQSPTTGTTAIFTSPESGRYAGPAHWSVTGGGPNPLPAGPAFGAIEAKAPNNTFQVVSAFSYGATPPAVFGPMAVMIPAAPLRVRIRNNNAGTQTFETSIWADDWRAG